MAVETLTFSCPHCQKRLTVPAEMAGISGPCPSCRGAVTAPVPEPVPEPVAQPALLPLQKAVSKTVPRAVQATREVEIVPTPPLDEEVLTPSRPRIRPEPRRVSDRSKNAPISTRQSTEDRRAKSKEDSFSDSGRRSYRLIHALIPATFLVTAASLVGTLIYFYGPGAPIQRIKDASGPLVVQPPKESPSAPPRTADRKAVDSGSAEPEPAPAGSSDTGTSEVRSESAAVVAYAVLEAFLKAEDAASRVDLVEPATSEQDLAATVLKGSLPEVARIFSDIPQNYPDEQRTDFPYRVSFVVKDSPNVDFAILVSKRGTQAPRVFLPAFLDLVGGRLADFTREPNRLPPAPFHVYLEPIDGCYEKDVPGADRRFTFKLLPSPFGKETARAYASNASRFRKLVEDPAYPIRWGMRRRATVTLEWNHKEDPAKPFLELVDLNSPDWSP